MAEFDQTFKDLFNKLKFYFFFDQESFQILGTDLEWSDTENLLKEYRLKYPDIKNDLQSFVSYMQIKEHDNHFFNVIHKDIYEKIEDEK